MKHLRTERMITNGGKRMQMEGWRRWRAVARWPVRKIPGSTGMPE
jgi:hypothetical protein